MSDLEIGKIKNYHYVSIMGITFEFDDIRILRKQDVILYKNGISIVSVIYENAEIIKSYWEQQK